MTVRDYYQVLGRTEFPLAIALSVADTRRGVDAAHDRTAKTRAFLAARPAPLPSCWYCGERRGHRDACLVNIVGGRDAEVEFWKREVAALRAAMNGGGRNG